VLRARIRWPVSATRSIADVDATPPEQSSVNRPGTRSQERQRSAERCEQNVNPRIAALDQEDHHLENRRERSRNGRPQTGEKQQSENDLDNEDGGGPHREIPRQPTSPAIDQGGACHQSHDQQSRARQPCGKCGKETSHPDLVRRYGIPGRWGKTRKGRGGTLSSQGTVVPLTAR